LLFELSGDLRDVLFGKKKPPGGVRLFQFRLRGRGQPHREAQTIVALAQVLDEPGGGLVGAHRSRSAQRAAPCPPLRHSTFYIS
jgi:hypothetical protein